MRHGKYEANNNNYRTNQPYGRDREGFTKTVFLYLHDFVYLLLVIMLVLVLFLRVVVVSGSSMKNTLVDGDYLLLLSNILYQDPKQGDIVVACKDTFRNGEPIIKRIIALEGQTVDIDFSSGKVYVDGKLLHETYIGSPTTVPEGVRFPVVVDEGCVFVLGDNRMDSQDSRSPAIGMIDQREILGRAIFLIIPGNDKGNSPRDFTRIGGLD